MQWGHIDLRKDTPIIVLHINKTPLSVEKWGSRYAYQKYSYCNLTLLVSGVLYT